MNINESDNCSDSNIATTKDDPEEGKLKHLHHASVIETELFTKQDTITTSIHPQDISNSQLLHNEPAWKLKIIILILFLIMPGKTTCQFVRMSKCQFEMLIVIRLVGVHYMEATLASLKTALKEVGLLN